MFQLNGIRKSRIWQEAHEEGLEKGALTPHPTTAFTTFPFTSVSRMSRPA
jgi:hypothetical protein